MKFFIQYGAGMMGHSRFLIDSWKGGNVILSPANLLQNSLFSIGNDLTTKGAEILIDPQYYFPDSNKDTLVSHKYFLNKPTGSKFTKSEVEFISKELIELNQQIHTSKVIIPGVIAEEVNDEWIEMQNDFFQTASGFTDLPIIVTICVSSDVVLDQDQIEGIVQSVNKTNVHAYYLVIEPFKNGYYVENTDWVINSLDLGVSLQKLGKKVIYGYSNPQQLLLSCGGIYGCASGNFLNTRIFQKSKYFKRTGGSPRSHWFYCPQLFSEYTIVDLFNAFRFPGLKKLLYPEPDSQFSPVLFNAIQPDASGWDEGISFRHYLDVYKKQVEILRANSFDEIVGIYRSMLDKAEEGLKFLHQEDITGRYRDFFPVINTNRLAIRLLEQIHGPYLRREWDKLYSA